MKVLSDRGHNPVWCIDALPTESIKALASACDIPFPVARILYLRGYRTPQLVHAFLNPKSYRHPDPLQMRDMQQAVDRILAAIHKGERILVYGDYDVDGQAGTALLLQALNRLGADPAFYIPHRLEEGYGLSSAAIASLAGGVDLLVTVDCGITSVVEVAQAAALGIDTVVTDHHQPGEELPAAVAVLNPKRSDCGYPDKELSGCGVAFKLAHALFRAAGRDPAELDECLDLVALATIADVVPLVGENRAFVAKGLERFAQRPGLRALCEVAGVDPTAPKSGHVAFLVAPRLNAAGRLDDAALGVRLLLASDESEARRLAEILDRHNRERQDVEKQILREAQAWIEERIPLEQSNALVVPGRGWHRGVIGIVASRLVESYGRPALVLSIEGEEAVGSGRSIPSFNLFEALSKLKGYFTRFGGHSMAAGLTLPARNIEAFTSEFVALANGLLTPTDLQPFFRVDAVLEPHELTVEVAEALAKLTPFGMGNPEPVVAAFGGVLCESRRVGQDQVHWRMAVRLPGAPNGVVGGIGFGLADAFVDKLEIGSSVDVIGSLSVNEWNGAREPQLLVRSVRKDEAGLLRTIEMQLLRAAHDPEVPDVPFVEAAKLDARDIRLFDWRHSEGDARTKALRACIEGGGQVLVWVADPECAGLVSRIRLQDARGLEAEVLICVNELPARSSKVQRVALLLWSVPSEAEDLGRLVAQALDWAEEVDLHLPFSKEVIAEVESELARDFPTVETLRELYRSVRIRCAQGPQAVTLDELRRIAARTGVDLSPHGVLFGLNVFAEVELIKLEKTGPGHTYVVTMLPAPTRKVDLTQALRYNEGIDRRRRLTRALMELATVSGPDLLAPLLCKAASN